MNAVRWWQRAAGLLMVLFLLTVGWKMRAFIWTAVQNAVVRSWYPVWGTNLRDIPDSEEGKRHRLAGWKKQTQGCLHRKRTDKPKKHQNPQNVGPAGVYGFPGTVFRE